MKVAIVHDWMYGGGAEKVVLELHKLYPDAPIYTSYCSDEWRKRLDGKVVTGYLQHAPFRQLRKFLPLLRQWWFARLDLRGFDLVISSSGNGEAKFARAVDGTHVCYCHTPNHFYWRHYDKYLRDPGFRPKWLASLGLRLLVSPLKRRDYQAAQKVDHFIANSSQIAKDIKKYYGRESTLIFPPVDTMRITRQSASKRKEQRSGFVTVGRQVPMKRTEVIVEACKRLRLPLTVIGNGPEHGALVSGTGPTIHFKTNLTDEEVAKELARAEAFIFASHEDFGIAPVEALAAGTPVIAYKAGGALDYVRPGETGEFFDAQTPESLMAVLQEFEAKKYRPDRLQAAAQQFSAEAFKKHLRNFIAETVR